MIRTRLGFALDGRLRGVSIFDEEDLETAWGCQMSLLIAACMRILFDFERIDTRVFPSEYVKSVDSSLKAVYLLTGSLESGAEVESPS